jgi:hypothetical protein
MLERKGYIESKTPSEEPSETFVQVMTQEPPVEEVSPEVFFQPEPEVIAPVFTPPAPEPPPVVAQPATLSNWPSSDFTPAKTDYDAFTEVSDIYRGLNIPLSGTDTIYLIEEYISTLPDTLPAEMRRSIVLKIVSASGFDFDRMLNDGIDRVTRLDDYSSNFSARTSEILAEYEQEIVDLNEKINSIKVDMDERKNLHKKQFMSLEAEAQRLKEVLDFITK